MFLGANPLTKKPEDSGYEILSDDKETVPAFQICCLNVFSTMLKRTLESDNCFIMFLTASSSAVSETYCKFT